MQEILKFSQLKDYEMDNVNNTEQLTLNEIGVLRNIIARQITNEGSRLIDDNLLNLLMETRKIFMAMGGEKRQLEVEHG